MAQAQDPSPRSSAPAQAETELLCKTFKVTPDDPYGGVFETTDTTDPIGKWVQDQRSQGWAAHSSDLEFAVKGTGFPVAYNQVCLSRLR